MASDFPLAVATGGKLRGVWTRTCAVRSQSSEVWLTSPWLGVLLQMR